MLGLGLFYEVLIALCMVFGIYFVNKQTRPAVLGIYSCRNKYYYVKVLFLWSLLTIRKRICQLYNEVRIYVGKKSNRNTLTQLDKPQPLSSHPQAIDAVYFNATSQDGSCLIGGTARRPNGLVNGFLFLKIEEDLVRRKDRSEHYVQNYNIFGSRDTKREGAGSVRFPKMLKSCKNKVPVDSVGLLMSMELPDTSLQQTSDEEGTFSVCGLTFTPNTSMTSWIIQFNGKMRCRDDPNRVIPVVLNAVYTSYLPHFDFDEDMSALGMAQAMARENWSKEYFNTVKELHQTHYEQFGQILGNAVIDGVQHNLNLSSIRDHSFGNQRDWKNFHRYALHFIFLENGDRINVAQICIPLAFSSLPVGFVATEKTRKKQPITSCDLKLYQHGENGTPPKDYAFTFTAGCKKHTVSVLSEDSFEFYIGAQWECHVFERPSKFNVDGINGWGVVEWQYRHIGGKSA